MASGNNLDALFADGELPFGHPGRRFADTPEGFSQSSLVDQGPERDYTPDEDGPCWFRQHHRHWRRAHRPWVALLFVSGTWGKSRSLADTVDLLGRREHNVANFAVTG